MSQIGGSLQGFPNNNAPVVEPGAEGVLHWSPTWLRWAMQIWGRTGAAQGGAVSPTGMITAYGAANPPMGWLICNGQAVDRTVYAALFTVIGTTWGPGDGSTTFNLPDLANRTAIGAASIPLGARGGNASVTLVTANLPAHSHSITDPGHSHSTFAASSTNTTGSATGAVTTGGTTGSAMTGITNTNNTGNGTSFSILPPYAAVIFMIKT